MLDANGQALPDDHPLMVTVLTVWRETTYEVRRAFIFVTLHNSRDEDDMRLTDSFMCQVQQILTPH